MKKCLNPECENITDNPLYCSQLCKYQCRYNAYIEKWLSGTITGLRGNHGSVSRQVKKYILERDSHKCVLCGLGDTWNKQPLTLQIDHIDGDWRNNTSENLRSICPNCHTQTDNYGSKNFGNGRPK
jgi:5-methylcytosine-specific restriction endonuclease McrA